MNLSGYALRVGANFECTRSQLHPPLHLCRNATSNCSTVFPKRGTLSISVLAFLYLFFFWTKMLLNSTKRSWPHPATAWLELPVTSKRNSFQKVEYVPHYFCSAVKPVIRLAGRLLRINISLVLKFIELRGRLSQSLVVLLTSGDTISAFCCTTLHLVPWFFQPLYGTTRDWHEVD